MRNKEGRSMIRKNPEKGFRMCIFLVAVAVIFLIRGGKEKKTEKFLSRKISLARGNKEEKGVNKK